MNQTIKQFVAEELEHTLQVLNQAIHNHRQWLISCTPRFCVNSRLRQIFCIRQKMPGVSVL